MVTVSVVDPDYASTASRVLRASLRPAAAAAACHGSGTVLFLVIIQTYLILVTLW